MLRRRSIGSIIFDILIYTILFLFAVVTIVPFLHVIAGSFASSEELLKSKFLIFPKKPTLDAYRYIFSTSTLSRSLFVTIFVTIAGTIVNLIMTTIMAYPLAHRDLVGRKFLMYGVTFTLLFSGGMIPTYLVVKGLGLIDSLAALIIPGAISTFNLILMKNFFQQLPPGLEESAKIDGCNDLMILARIVIPLSLPALATFTLFYAVGHWNTFMSALLYINDSSKWTIQVLLRQIVILSQGGIGDEAAMGDSIVIPPQTVKMACIVFSTVPILMVYPFIQKYFAKGVLVGSLKG